MRPWLVVTLLLMSACGDADQNPRDSRVGSGTASVTGETVDETTFWTIIEDARRETGGEPELMAEHVAARFGEADDDTLRSFQTHLVEAGRRLYTWQHGAAAEMICGFVSDDVFTDWRSWVVAQGRETFERVVADPDNLADVQDLSGGCEAGGEFFGAAVAGIYFDRHGYGDDFPIVEPQDGPSGEPVTDPAAIRASLPRLAARIPRDGLGQEPRTFDEPD